MHSFDRSVVAAASATRMLFDQFHFHCLICSTNKGVKGTPSAEETIAVLHAYRSGTKFRLNVRDSRHDNECVDSESWGMNALTLAYRCEEDTILCV